MIPRVSSLPKKGDEELPQKDDLGDNPAQAHDKQRGSQGLHHIAIDPFIEALLFLTVTEKGIVVNAPQKS